MNRRQFLTTLVGLVAVPSIVGRAMSAPKAEPIPKRKLKAVWTVECEQDLLSMHGISVDDELVADISRQMRVEIDGEILERLGNYA